MRFRGVGATLIDEPLVGEHFARLERTLIPSCRDRAPASWWLPVVLLGCRADSSTDPLGRS
jgi:hypothetical protein